MATPNTFIKHSAETLVYSVDFNPWLAALPDSGSGYTVSVPVGLSQPNASSLVSGVVSFWIAGGTDNVKYAVVIVLTTTLGRIKEETVYIKVQE